jgi:DNA polymerase III subunit gamma/tau
MVGTGTICSTEGARHFDLARARPEEPVTAAVPHQAIYRRWRAQTFGEIVGQEAVVETLRNAVRTNHVAHAILFVGPRGTGKTSLARILAKAVNCTDLRDGDACDACPSCVAIREGTTLDLVEIDAASNRGIDAVRELRERLPYPPGELKRKVYILDEAHQITKDAWNALLKSLEEPPDFVTFMFASTEPSGFPAAILSRLQRYDVRRLTVPEIEGKLARILEADGRTADPAAIALIARLAAGGMRDAESMLDQLLSAAPDTIDERRVRDLLGLADAEAVDGFVEALVAGDAATGIALLDGLEERGRDARILLDQAIDAIRGRLVEGLASGDGRAAPGLTDAARRLAAIDPDRAGVGGLRLQLELALFANAGRAAGTGIADAATSTATAPQGEASRPPVQRPAATTSGPAAPRARPVRDTPTRPPEASPPVAAAASGPPRVSEPVAVTSEAKASVPSPTTADEAARAAVADGASQPEGAPPEEAPVAAAPDDAVPTATAAEPTQPAAAEPTAPAETPSVDPSSPEEPLVVEPSPPVAAEAPPVAAEAPPVAGEPAASPVPEPIGDGLAALLAAWPDVVSRLSADPPTKPLILACRPVAVDGAIVTLGFPEEQSFLKDAIERRRAKIEAGIAESLGHEVSVRCVVANIEVAPPPDPRSEGALVMAEAGRIFADVRVDVGEVD